MGGEGVSKEYVLATLGLLEALPLMHPGAEPGPSDLHNLALLESVLSEEDLDRLRPLVGRRLPLEELDAAR